MAEKLAKIMWLGHAAFKLEIAEKIVLVDPWLDGNPLSPMKASEITRADVVYVTHDHFDHMGDAVKICKKTKAVFVGTFELASEVGSQGVKNVIGLNIGGSTEINGIRLHVVQAFHTAFKGAPTGVIVEGGGKSVYHAGDTGIFGDMKIVGTLYKPDVALIPVGGYYTMDALEAAEAVKLINPKTVIPMHYKTFPVLAQSADEFIKQVKKKAPEVKAVVLKPGESYTF